MKILRNFLRKLWINFYVTFISWPNFGDKKCKKDSDSEVKIQLRIRIRILFVLQKSRIRIRIFGIWRKRFESESKYSLQHCSLVVNSTSGVHTWLQSLGCNHLWWCSMCYLSQNPKPRNRRTKKADMQTSLRRCNLTTRINRMPPNLFTLRTSICFPPPGKCILLKIGEYNN